MGAPVTPPGRLWAWWCALPWRTCCLIAFLWTLAWSLAFGLVVFDRTPHIPDGATYLFQAKVFASGRLVAPRPALPEFFTGGEMVLTDTAWFGKYPPGQSLVLVPGVLIGAPWLMPALCAACAAVGAGVLARRWTTESVARLTLLFAGSSPFLLTHGGMYLAHVSGAAVFVWWVVLLDRVFSERWGLGWALAGGVAIGFLFWIRPFSAVALAAPAMLFCAWRLFRPRPGDRPRILALACAGLVMVAGLLAYNRATTGDPFLFGYHMGKFKETATIGFQPYPRHGGYVQYTPALAVRKTLIDLWWISTETLGLPFPVLALVVVALLPPADRRTRALALFPASLLVFQFFYYYSDNNHGPRMYLEAAPFLFILSAAGALRVAQRTPLRAGTCAFALALVWVVIMPWKMHTYGSNYAGLPNLARPFTRDLHHALLFLDTNHVMAQQNHILTLNTPTLDGDVVYARDRGPENVQLAQRYPDRDCYRLRYWITGSLTNAIVAGPTFAPYDPAGHAERAAAMAGQPRASDVLQAVLGGMNRAEQ